MARKAPKRPRDPNQLAKFVIDVATGAREDGAITPEEGKDPAAIKLGRLGGEKGGLARAASLTPEERKRIASEAAQARWGKKPDKT